MSYTPSIFDDKNTILEQLEAVKELIRNIDTDALANLNDLVGRALKTPLARPQSTEVVAVDNTNAQIMVKLGDDLVIKNGYLEVVPNIHLHLADTSGNESFITLRWLDNSEIGIYSDSDENYVIRGTLETTNNIIDVNTDGKANCQYTFRNNEGQTIGEGSMTISAVDTKQITVPLGAVYADIEIQSY